MASPRKDKRARLTESASELAYRQGFDNTTLGHIAQTAKVPLGNVYYYFKTKEEIGEAILAQRTAELLAYREAWDRIPQPRQRLMAFMNVVLDQREQVARKGCRFGTLVTEMSKAGGPLARKARDLFNGHLNWLETQFRLLGKGDQAGALALHLMALQQGATVMANACGDPDIVTREVDGMRRWIEQL